MMCTSSDTPCELRPRAPSDKHKRAAAHDVHKLQHAVRAPSELRPISTNARRRMMCTSSDAPCELRPISTNARRRMMCTSSDTPCASNKIRRIKTNARWGVACTGSIIPRTSEIQQFCRCRSSASHASILTYKQTLLFLTPYRTLRPGSN
ncbi:hypothetical protein HanHA300_Chr09g0317641 [Helianthus annuus]|nr:hypothetical protein HanHA300_Chr09g0317641 [Helianthus annuus]KAJ0542334.1 hypothetical protein HanHA89_Chr09g0338621 [Helianthus annuus]KAJ0707376.1 hypothetical protein HanLR1_Chr09g0317761 [Helianthus annuus]